MRRFILGAINTLLAFGISSTMLALIVWVIYYFGVR